MSDRKELLIFYQAPWDWDFLWNRSQPLARELSKSCTVVYLNNSLSPYFGAWKILSWLPSFISRRISPGALFQLSETLYYYVNFNRKFDHGMTAKDRSDFANRKLLQKTQQLIKTHKRFWLVTSRATAKSLLTLLPWEKVVVDIEDPWLSLDWMTPKIAAQIPGFLERADVIISNGPRIAAEYSKMTEKEIHPILNAVDEDFTAAFERSTAPPDWLSKDSGKKKVLYTGNISDRMDFITVTQLIQKFPQLEFHFVGHKHLKKPAMKSWKKLMTASNAFDWPPVTHSQLPGILNQADILLIPHLHRGAREMFPAKLFEYLAAGKWILSSVDYRAELGAVPGFVVCQSAEDYEAAISNILQRNWVLSSEDIKKQRELARQNTWAERGRQFFEIVEASGVYAGR